MKKKIKRCAICVTAAVILTLAMSSTGYVLAKEGVIHTDNEVLNTFFEMTQGPIDYLFYRGIYENSVELAEKPEDVLTDYQDDASTERSLKRQEAAMKYALEKGIVSPEDFTERKAALLEKNPALRDEEADEIAAMQVYSITSDKIMTTVLPSLLDGSFETSDKDLRAAMDHYGALYNELDPTGEDYIRMETKLALELYDHYLDYLVKLYC
jgi:hypothetical protein